MPSQLALKAICVSYHDDLCSLFYCVFIAFVCLTTYTFEFAVASFLTTFDSKLSLMPCGSHGLRIAKICNIHSQLEQLVLLVVVFAGTCVSIVSIGVLVSTGLASVGVMTILGLLFGPLW